MSDDGVISEMLSFGFALAGRRTGKSVSVSGARQPDPLTQTHEKRCAQTRISPAISKRFGSSRLRGKNNPLLILRKSASFTRHPASSKRGVRVVTIRGVRVAVDAMALRARGIAGRPQALSWGCERLIRAGRATLLRTAKACGSGTRGWCQAGGGCSNPTGFVGPSIRQRRRQEEFVSGESAA